MHHDVSLIAMVATGFLVAFVFGFAANKIGLPPLVGYLVGGVLIGPHTPGFVGDTAIAGQLAEIGVMLLMFGVGLHFSVADLAAVRRIAIPGAVGQIVLATGLGSLLAFAWGWSFGAGLVLGLCISVASTVVLLKALESRNALGSPNGRIAVGWLVVEDMAMVVSLVLIPAFAGVLGGDAGADLHDSSDSLWLTLGLTMLKLGAFVAVALGVGPRVLPWLLRHVARTGSRELFTLAVLAVALGIAFASAKIFGVSFALGAFFAGVVLSESELSHKAAANSLPLQDAFSVLFFVSVGMIFDPGILVREPLNVAAVVALIMVGKSLISFAIVLVLGYPVTTGLLVSAALAQVGEFSFILAGLGVTYKLLPPEGLDLILAGALVSITLNPIVFSGMASLCHRLQALPNWRFRAFGAKNFARLEEDLRLAEERAAARKAATKTFDPEELVDRFPLFAGLNHEQREALILHFEPRSAAPGERIICKGEQADGMFFIASGQVEVAVPHRPVKLAAGDFFGEMALISGEPRSADVTAIDYTRLASLSAKDFRRFLAKFPEVKGKISALAQSRRESNLATETAAESAGNPPTFS